MTTPLPLGGAPYVSPLTVMSAPTGVDWTSIPVGDDITPAQNMAEMWNICARATARANAYCNQVLRATVDVEVAHGPDYYLQVGPAAGGKSISSYWGNFCNSNARIVMSRWPILQVSTVKVCPSNTWPRAFRTLPAGWAEPENPPLGIYNSVAPSSAGEGSQAILIGPGYIDWTYGRNGYICEITYINGWPHAEITANAAAGAQTLTVDDTTGWAITSYQGTYTGATGVIKDSGRQEVVQVLSASTTSGPGTLALSSPLTYPHVAGTLVTTFPANVEQACILFAAAEALTRGATTTTIHDIGGHAQQTGGDIVGLTTEAELLIHPFRRTI